MRLLMITMMLWMPGCIGAGRNSDLTTPVGRNDKSAFPQMVGIDLHGKERRVPQDIPGDTRLIISAYLREQQADVDTWIAQLDTIRERVPGVSFSELPVIDKGNPLFRWWVNNGMRSGIRDEQRRREVITVYTDVRAFLDAIGQAGNDTITVMLVDSRGTILSKELGRFDPQKLNRLIAPIEKNSNK